MAKKLLPVLILLLHCTLFTFAQSSNFVVESFYAAENDQTVRATNRLKDKNNRMCALVKIETSSPLKDLSFDAGMVGVERTEQKKGEIWLYLPAGARRITIKHEHLGIIRSYPFGEPLKEATVYIMKLKAAKVHTIVEEGAALQYLVITCATDGATVKIDDSDTKFINGKRFTKSLTYGKHRYVVEAPMHHPMSGVVTITAERGALVDAQLKPMFGMLSITSMPESDADVFVDGEWRGKTPLTLDKLKSGTYRVRVAKSRYLPYEQAATVADGETTRLPVTLKPNFADITLSTTSTASNQSITAGGVTFDMIYVAGGTFTMGCTAEQGSDCHGLESPSHSVTLSGYHIGKFEVTQALWYAVMGDNPSYRQGDNLPVEQVSWASCQTFISRLNSLTGKQFRLPTEAEWEYAASGGAQSRGYKYSGSHTPGEVAWYTTNSGSRTHEVGSKQPNELDIYDMSGNVWEWCSDWYGGYGSNPQSNPTGDASGWFRVYRGGGWSGGAHACRVSARRGASPGNSICNIGLRLVLPL